MRSKPAKPPARSPARPAAPQRPAATPAAPPPAATRRPAAAHPAQGLEAAAEGRMSMPLSEDEIAQLQTLLETLPVARDPLDAEMADGYLCGVLLQPQPVPEAAWLPRVMDMDGRPPAPGFDAAAVRDGLRRRHAELERAIAGRQWFDPWVFPLEDAHSPSDTVMPWVAGFATAVDLFPQLMDRHEDALLEPLATLYRHLDPDDLEDADALLAEIETYEPPATLDEAVEDLVRSVLLIADVSRPRPAPPAHRPANGPLARRPSRGPRTPRG